MATTLRRKESDSVDRTTALALGVSGHEYDFIIDKLGRQINESECLLIAAMWCERISKKSLAGLLKEVAQQNSTANNQIRRAVDGMRFLDIGDGHGVCLSLVQANEESSVFPEYSAALSISNALERLIPNSVNPLGALSLVRVGGAEVGESQYAIRAMVNGCAWFSNMAGVPLSDLNFEFVSDLNKDSGVLNSAVLGLVDTDLVVRSSGDAISDAVLVYVGLRSQTGVQIEEDGESSRVQRKAKASSPFLHDCLLRAMNQARKENLLIDATSLSYGGALVGCFTLAYRNNVGLIVYADKIPIDKKEPELSDVLFSETPHRLLVLIHKDKHRKFSDILRKYNLDSVAIGNVADTTDVNFCWGHYVVAGLPAKLVVDGMVADNAHVSNPSNSGTIVSESSSSQISMSRTAPMELLNHVVVNYAGIDDPLELGDRWIELIATPNAGSRDAVRGLFDLRSNGRLLPDINNGVSIMSVGGSTRKGIASCIKANCLYSQFDSYLGTAHTIADAMRVIAATGATPRALGYCLNYPDIGNRMVVRHLTESARAICDACDVWDIQVLADEVSTISLAAKDLDVPTPTIALVGVMQDVQKRVPNYIREQGLSVFLLGQLPSSLGCSAYVTAWYGKEACVVPEIDFEAEKRLCDLLVELNQLELLSCATAVASGGLALALVRSVTGSTQSKLHGMTISLLKDLAPEVCLFGEGAGLVIVCCRAQHGDIVREYAKKRHVNVLGEGTTGGQNIVCKIREVDYSLNLKAARRVSGEALSHMFDMRKEEYRIQY